MQLWMHFAGLNTFGRIATRMATLAAPPHKASVFLANYNPKGYVAPSALIYHSELSLGANIYIGDRVILFQNRDGGSMKFGDRVCVLRDCAIETGRGGTLTIGAHTWIQPRCQINAYLGSISIGHAVDIAPNCALYAYDHGAAPGQTIRSQPLQTKGDIRIGDHAWLGVGVTVLSGVTIGEGAVIGAGSIVTKDVPDGAVAVGNPAKVVKMRKSNENTHHLT